jgi:biotin carboxyl carrier protein
MTFEVDVGGRTRAVSIERAAQTGEYRVTVDGRSHDVDVRRSGEYGLVLAAPTFPPKPAAVSADKSREDTKLGGRVAYEVFVGPSPESGEVLVTLGGRTVSAGINGRRRGRTADTSDHAPGEQPIVAPMPGRVVRVLVAPGDEVTARQGVVVVEAMKMENELRAPKGGRVKDVSVSAGASVEAGRVLVIIE